VSDVLARDLGERIHLGTPVQRVRVEHGAVVSVEAGGTTYPCDAVVSTLPAPVLPRLIEGSDGLMPLTKLRFRPVVLGFLEVDRPRVLDRLLVWFPEPEFLFYRLSEQKIADPSCAPAGKTLLTIEIACEEGSFAWTASEDELRKRLVDDIARVHGLPLSAFGKFESRRTRFGYPMYDLHTNDVRHMLEVESKSGGIQGLFLVGRSGSFRYILLEEAHSRAGVMADQILAWTKS
jgi:protoporphyrinogen oxidase